MTTTQGEVTTEARARAAARQHNETRPAGQPVATAYEISPVDHRQKPSGWTWGLVPFNLAPPMPARDFEEN